MKKSFVLGVLLLCACQSPTLYITEQGRPEGLSAKLDTIRRHQSDWQIEDFNNRFNPPKTSIPLLLYGSKVDEQSPLELLNSLTLPNIQTQRQQQPGHRATEFNAVLYFPEGQRETLEEEVLQFSVTRGDQQTDIYTLSNREARLSFSEWGTELERWRVISEERGKWQQQGSEISIASNMSATSYTFGFDIDVDYPMDWRLMKNAQNQNCWGYAYHVAPPADAVERSADYK